MTGGHTKGGVERQHYNQERRRPDKIKSTKGERGLSVVQKEATISGLSEETRKTCTTIKCAGMWTITRAMIATTLG